MKYAVILEISMNKHYQEFDCLDLANDYLNYCKRAINDFPKFFNEYTFDFLVKEKMLRIDSVREFNLDEVTCEYCNTDIYPDEEDYPIDEEDFDDGKILGCKNCMCQECDEPLELKINKCCEKYWEHIEVATNE
jgi:hypothetical protein